MASVLVVDDDLSTREMFVSVLARAGHDARSAASAREASKFLRWCPDVAFVDLRLPDKDGTNVLRSLRQASPATAIIMITGFGSVRSAVTAMRWGAMDYLEKPVDIDVVLRMVDDLVFRQHTTGGSAQSHQQPHAAGRWAEALVVPVIALPNDPSTVSRWALDVHVSAGAIRTWCRTAGVPVKPTLNLARMLRLQSLYEPGCRLTNILNIVDSRTLINFLRLGVPGGPPCQMPLPLDELLVRQHWITNRFALAALRRTLRTGSDPRSLTMRAVSRADSGDPPSGSPAAFDKTKCVAAYGE